ncbi:MAG: CoA ester lyase [Pseudomonadota bacterium]
MAVFRSFLFTPGNHDRRVEKCLQSTADAAILDLEDAVAIAEKEATRAIVVKALAGPRRGLGYVRINAFDTAFCYGDIMAVVQPGVDGIVLPKLESPEDLHAVDWLITQLEKERGLAVGGIDILPIIETGKGLDAIDAICRAGSRVKRLSFGAGDFTLDMGIRWTRGEREIDYARARFILASRAAGLEPPIDTVFISLGEPDNFRRSAELARDMGFQGKLCIHPEQVDVTNEVFSPSDEEIALARRYIEAFNEAEAAGSASIQVDGQFLDYPIVEKARRVLAAAAAIGK